MKKWKIVSVVFTFVLGTLGAFSQVGAMLLSYGERDCDTRSLLRSRVLCRGICVELSVNLGDNDLTGGIPSSAVLKMVEGQTGGFFNRNAQVVIFSKNTMIIPKKCFDRCRQLAFVVFEQASQLKAIGSEAFRDISLLSSICIPASVESLGAQCFSNCQALFSVTFEPYSRLTGIGPHAFLNCASLPFVVLPTSVEAIGDSCFVGCKRLASLTFESPSQLRTIGSNMCSGSPVQSLSIPASVEILGDFCLAGCPSLASLTFETGSQLTRMGRHAFFRCTSLSSIDVPSRVEIIEASCFLDCASLFSITFETGSHLRTIGPRAFSATRIRSISIPSSVETFGNSCFAGCLSLSSVTFEPDSHLREVGLNLFYNSPLMGPCDFPNGVTPPAEQPDQSPGHGLPPPSECPVQ
ncbi:MAG: leucine-rich repeat domain-containing protein [Holosporales bacterium]|nr:leucine-rich repeat domain-containing protein [Holosporales bacterium]